MSRDNNSNSNFILKNNPIILDISDSIARAFTQEVLLALFITFFVILRIKTISFFKNLELQRDYFNKDSKIKKINTILKDIGEAIKADRVILGQLHNGSSFLGCLSQVKLTITNHFTRNGIEVLPPLINFPISYIYKEMELLEGTKSFIWLDYETSAHSCQAYLIKKNIKLLGLHLIHNKLELPVAILGIHYCSYDVSISYEDKCKRLQPYILELENILSNKM